MPFEAKGVTAEWFKKTYGGLADHDEDLITVGTARIQVLPLDPERTSIVFCNVSADFIVITPTTRIAAGSGIRLAPNGGLASIVIPEDAPMPSMPWFAIADTAGRDLYILTTKRVAKIAD